MEASGNTVTFIAYLGDNTVPIARDLAARLGLLTGLDLAYDPDLPWPQRLAAIQTGGADLLWMCSLPMLNALDAGRLDAEIVAAPVFPGHDGPTYRSVIIARRQSGFATLAHLRGRRLAINERMSWSGHHALRVHLASAGERQAFFGEIVKTGSHAASIDAVLAGAAEVAAIDDTIWEHRLLVDDRLRDLVVVDRTRAWPAPPFALSRALGSSVRDVLSQALVGTTPSGLDAIVPATTADYDPIRRGMAISRGVRW